MLQLWLFMFLIRLEVRGHTVPHWKALRYGKDGSRGLNCGSTLSIRQDLSKSEDILNKWGFVDFQIKTSVSIQKISLNNKLPVVHLLKAPRGHLHWHPQNCPIHQVHQGQWGRHQRDLWSSPWLDSYWNGLWFTSQFVSVSSCLTIPWLFLFITNHLRQNEIILRKY